MQIDIISVGSIKKKYIQDAIFDYVTRIERFCKVREIVVKDENNSFGEIEVLKREGNRILEKIHKKSYVVVFDLRGEMFTSDQFSNKISDIQIRGFSHITFIIGGSMGVDDSLREAADLKISFSKMTFPHQLFKVLALEQIYRSFKILNGQNYHK